MKNLIAINGSPRRNGNTAQLLKQAMQGAESVGASTEIVHLYSLTFTGCTSCFACKLKTHQHYGDCARKDGISPVLKKIKDADAVIFGAPIYFMNISAGMLAFLERLFFANYIYSDEIPTVFGKKLPNAFFYTMNMTEKHFAQFNMKERLGFIEMTAEKILGVEPKIFHAFDTVQFQDYSRYESSIFNPEEKFAHREKQFPVDLATAFDIGKNLVSQ